MSGQYFRISDLGEIDMTFDSEPPPPKEKRTRITEPTKEQLVVEKRRKKSAKNFSGSKKDEQVPEDPYEAPNDSPPSSVDIDELLYGGPPIFTEHTDPPKMIAPDPSLPKKKKMDFLPYVAGMAILGFLIFFLVQKKRSN